MASSKFGLGLKEGKRSLEFTYSFETVSRRTFFLLYYQWHNIIL